MKIDFVEKPDDLRNIDLSGLTVVVMDVLRATTTIIVALSHGCKYVVPFEEVNEVFQHASKLPVKRALKCGERYGKKVEGFDLGNSPVDYVSTVVSNKVILLSTTNGTRALLASKKAAETIILSLVNMSAVAEYLSKKATELLMIAAGTNNAHSVEDTYCAGMLMDLIMKNSINEIIMSENAHSALKITQKYGENISAMFMDSKHGKYLHQLGFEADLELCAKLDSVPIVPKYENGKIQLINANYEKQK